ncbi:hypothetical protein CKM354_001028000 [Cercospora kikuchii]|uniref:Transmembrane protein n=1 Tax=Cercospora kikuchii TaxID=84275 RepID=A0A9P3CR77_9PEZI|nr:uncharacterized protein CKM354_001028000 [Cercospora kikuchii]GIZ47181.1 hypothetical protein CKM354_001028000 [Cercospora kikuchii]
MSETVTFTTTTCEREESLSHSTAGNNDDADHIAITVVDGAVSEPEGTSCASSTTSDDSVEAKDFQTMMAILIPTALLTLFAVACVAGSRVSGQMEDASRELAELSIATEGLDESKEPFDENVLSSEPDSAGKG